MQNDSSKGPANTRSGRKRRRALGDQLRDPKEAKKKKEKSRHRSGMERPVAGPAGMVQEFTDSFVYKEASAS